MVVLLSTIYNLSLGVLTFIQIRRLWSNNEKSEGCIYALTMAVSAVIGTLIIAGVEVPTLVFPYKTVFEPIGKAILSS